MVRRAYLFAVAMLLVAAPAAMADLTQVTSPAGAGASVFVLTTPASQNWAPGQNYSDGTLGMTISTPSGTFAAADWGAPWGADGTVLSTTPNLIYTWTSGDWNAWPNWPTSTDISLTAPGTITAFGFELAPTSGTFAFTVSFFNGQTLLGTITQNASYGQAQFFGGLSATGITSVHIDSATDYAIGNVQYTDPVPEPASFFLLASGLSALAFRKFRK